MGTRGRQSRPGRRRIWLNTTRIGNREWTHGGVINIPPERRDARTTRLDNQNQTPPLLVLLNGHDEFRRALRENANCYATNCGSQASLPLFAGGVEGCAVDMQCRSCDLNPNTTAFSAQHAPPLACLDERGEVLCLEDPVPQSAGRPTSPTESPMLPQPLLVLPLKPIFPRNKPDPNPNNTRSTLFLAPNRYFLFACFFCLLALVYVSSPPLPHILIP